MSSCCCPALLIYQTGNEKAFHSNYFLILWARHQCGKAERCDTIDETWIEWTNKRGCEPLKQWKYDIWMEMNFHFSSKVLLKMSDFNRKGECRVRWGMNKIRTHVTLGSMFKVLMILIMEFESERRSSWYVGLDSISNDIFDSID